jgi:hypothetical protein
MDEPKKKPAAVIQIGIGIVLILISVGALIILSNELQYFGFLLIGIGNLLAGFSNNNSDLSPKGKALSYASAGCIFVGLILTVYVLFGK